MNEMIMVSYSLNNNTRVGLDISSCLNTNTLVSLIPPNRLKFPARWIQLLNKTENTRRQKLPQNSLKTSESYKTWENTFDETLE